MDMEDILKGVEQYYESVECCLDCNNYSDRDNAFNCIFQEKQEKCPMCGEQHVFCSKCKRATLWSSIRRTCDSFELTNLAKEHLIEGLNEIIKKRR